jgi:chromosome segregation ATPase
MKKISDYLEDSKEQKGILGELNSSIEQKSDLEKIISDLNVKLRKIEEVKNKINEFVEDSKKFTKELKDALKKVDINQEEIRFVLYPENLEEILNGRKNKIENEIGEQKNKLSKLDEEIKELNSKITLEKSRQDKIKEINESLSDLKKKRDSANCDIEKIEDAEKTLPDLLNKRESLFINYFELIFEEKERLKKIYSPLENLLRESIEENEKFFEFTVKFNFDLNIMTDEGHKLIDLRADGRFRQTRPEILKEKLEELIFRLDLDREKISETDKESVKTFIKNVEGLFIENNRTISSQLKEKYIEQDFLNWLYSTRYYSISYSIKFNGLELNNLSPGLKGVALLILFLKLDKDDKRPILIDQPEENLDNRSVYTTLVRYFREAKKRRQVIIVTHNPNLVVNADSEQVIVANLDRDLENQTSRISYVSGSLENTFKNDSATTILRKQGIREHVCEILEGGEEAFKKREDKYQIK